MLRADERDSMAVLDIWLDAANWMRAQGIDQWMPDRFNLSEVAACLTGGKELFLLKENGIAAGTFYIKWSDSLMWEDGRAASAGYIHRLAVGRNHHGRGIGALMLDWAEQYIAESGKAMIRLDCMADNTRLNTYYSERGFQLVTRIDTRGWSANLFEKEAKLRCSKEALLLEAGG